MTKTTVESRIASWLRYSFWPENEPCVELLYDAEKELRLRAREIERLKAELSTAGKCQFCGGTGRVPSPWSKHGTVLCAACEFGWDRRQNDAPK